jgi:hypothetical protein
LVTATDERQAILGAATLRELGYLRLSVLSGGAEGWSKCFGKLQQAPDNGERDLVEAPYSKGQAEMRRYLDWEIRLTKEEAAVR